MANDYGIRSGLVSKGYRDEDIGYDQNTGYVQVKGQNFMKPGMNVQGTTYTSRPDFDNAYGQFRKGQMQPGVPNGNTGINPAAGMSGGTPQTGGSPYSRMGGAQNVSNPMGGGFTGQGFQQQDVQPNANLYADQITQLIADITNRLSAPQQDVYSTPQYAAAQAQQQRAAQQGIRSAQEALGSAGFGRSTTLGESANRIQNDANEYLQLQLVPQIQQQLAAQRQNEISNQFALLDPIFNQLSREDTLKQQDITNTGRMPLPQGAQDLINQLVRTKQEAESAGTAGATAEDMARFRSQGDLLRSQLEGMGVDISGLGMETSAADVRMPTSVQTIQGRTSALNEAKIKQDLKTGLIDQETAIFKLEQLKDPNSPVNQAAQIDLELKQLEAKYAEPEMKARIEQIRKQTAQIGAAPYRSQEDLEYDRVRLETAREELKQLKNKPNVAKAKETGNAAYSEFLTDLPRILSLEEGQALIDLYRQDGVDEDTLQTMLKAINSQFKE